MKANKVIKILSMFLIVLMVLMATNTVFAAKDEKSKGDTLTPSGVTASSTEADDDIKEFGGKILSAVTTAGVVLSVIVLAVLGIKYMLGSAEEKAEYKKTLMPYIIGAALIFGASTIATIVYNFMQ